MVASGVFITDMQGKSIISRNYRGDFPISKAIELFSKYLDEVDEEARKPIFHVDANGDFESGDEVGMSGPSGQTFVYVAQNNLYMCAVTTRNSNVALILTFLFRLGQVFKDYFGSLEEESIRDNFVIIYELLDETMDHGLPQALDSTILRSFITQGANRMAEDSKSKPPVALTNAVSWRAEGIKHKKNEIFLDVVEKLNLLVSANGTVLHSEINGAVKMKSFLSGMPELKLGLNDKLMFEATGRSNQARGKSVELEDIKFHQCVRLARFENDRTISFIPPDGEFDLMTYRLNTHVKPLIWVEAVVEPHKGSRIEYMIKTRSQFKSRSVANNVEIIIPVPPDVDSPSFKSSVGSVTYLPDKDSIVWNIKQFHGGREYLMRAHFGLPSITASDVDPDAKKKGENSWKAPIRVQFEIPYFTVSGIQVRYLKIIERSGYAALPWVRYITANGDYQLRMS
ncbi:AP-1 complex subunit mu [Seminavis robusta]|uniref:AP-1 complex subunit mu n=1 Tax=Seminavis robusta TaxID=568900 RepID=A0A9N8HJ82_9STRA|nr:AP-1 complex subunit mu [Seminavis robusta]|eukprot:Sro643_g180290.1 AP-1 complex subunit mu (455) ;mRNA; r:22123-23642